MAYQIAFDIADNENQHFCRELSAMLDTEPVLRSILLGEKQIDLNLEFLYRNNQTDLLMLETVKASVDKSNSVTHLGLVIAHALAQCGTTSDSFLRNNLEWMSQAVHWAKFTTTASLGVVHKGHVKESRKVSGSWN